MLQKPYTIGDDVLSQSSFTENGFSGTDYLLYDGHGSTRQLANAFGMVTAQYAYNGRNRLTGLQIRDAQSVLLNSFGYQLNAVGHRTRIDEANGRTRLFQYDNLNRLASEQITGDSAGVNGAVSYVHDLVGSAPSEARRFLRGASPRRARISHPLVPSVGTMEEESNPNEVV